MSPPLAFADALVQLKLGTSQTSNFTFTNDEITQALTKAWNDSYVCDEVWDTSLTYVSGTWQYPMPTGLSRLQDIYIQRTTTDNPEPISQEMYEIVAGNIQFNIKSEKWLSNTYPLLIKGLVKLTVDDELDTTTLVNYVISLASYILLSQLVLKKTFFFLKTDTTMSDIINARRDTQADVLRYKQQLRRQFESS